ncbi:hypothetical protein [Chryseobacterium lathyri]|uniref:Uncharacterized protein n=1 Tax=Chryseobacterium lathyri TaxID=395933 RepID=A0ABT9SS27_9FLAO|nr:hypothetical protein [Chryseobacterium lathyri]MDP9962251.1 hypothetical protein [Chryseobacterium lathyri]MDQ0068206.1 hypothetical protein [Chryseobacterium lathyri]
MNKKLLTAFAVSSCISLYAQSNSVGVSTPTPTETLDINGTERIRELPVDGTSNVIYTKPDGTRSINKDQSFKALKTLVADANGVLGSVNWMPAQPSQVISGADGLDAVTTTRTISAVNGVLATTPVLATKTFTLLKKSMVTFSYNISVSDIVKANGDDLFDGISKKVGAKLILNSKDIIDSGIPFTNSGQKYAFGLFYLNGNRSIILNEGTYTVNLVGYLFSHTEDSNGIRATFGATSTDQFDIIAIPVQ